MQFLEFSLVVFSIIFLVFKQPVISKIKKPYIIISLLFILIIHLLFEGYRWQMIPAYLLWTIALLVAIRNPKSGTSKIIKVLKGLGILILLILALALPCIFPVFELPKPTGQYLVGTRDIFLELDREEVITEEKDNRKLMIKVWYPTQDSDVEKDRYIDQAGRQGFAQKYGLPASTFNYLDKIETHVFREAEVADEAFPVLIFSHGYNSKANGYYALLSEIVSHGYIIFAINHTYESTGTSFLDGEMEFFDYNFAQKIEADTWQQMQPVREAFNNDLSFAERHPAVKKALQTYFVKDIVERWSADILM
ncbi:hypothetical protein E0K83_09510 [Gramella sp. BOM4]|nr:hypothetical protein [Christiangramia bathymodioli]